MRSAAAGEHRTGEDVGEAGPLQARSAGPGQDRSKVHGKSDELRRDGPQRRTRCRPPSQARAERPHGRRPSRRAKRSASRSAAQARSLVAQRPGWSRRRRRPAPGAVDPRISSSWCVLRGGAKRSAAGEGWPAVPPEASAARSAAQRCEGVRDRSPSGARQARRAQARCTARQPGPATPGDAQRQRQPGQQDLQLQYRHRRDRSHKVRIFRYGKTALRRHAGLCWN